MQPRFTKFRLCPNSQLFVTVAMGRSGANLSDTMKLADIENLQFGTRIWDIIVFSIQDNLWQLPNFLLKSFT